MQEALLQLATMDEAARIRILLKMVYIPFIKISIALVLLEVFRQVRAESIIIVQVQDTMPTSDLNLLFLLVCTLTDITGEVKRLYIMFTNSAKLMTGPKCRLKTDMTVITATAVLCRHLQTSRSKAEIPLPLTTLLSRNGILAWASTIMKVTAQMVVSVISV